MLHYHRKWLCSTTQPTLTRNRSCWTRSQMWTHADRHDQNSAKTNMESEYQVFMRKNAVETKRKRSNKNDLFHLQTCSWQFDGGTRAKSEYSCVQRNARTVSNHPFRRLCTWRRQSKPESDLIRRIVQRKINTNLFDKTDVSKWNLPFDNFLILNIHKQIYTCINDKLVGLLLRARKHKFVEFEGEMLFQRRDDDVPIFMLKTPDEIKEVLNEKIEEVRRSSSPNPQPTNILIN